MVPSPLALRRSRPGGWVPRITATQAAALFMGLLAASLIWSLFVVDVDTLDDALPDDLPLPHAGKLKTKGGVIPEHLQDDAVGAEEASKGRKSTGGATPSRVDPIQQQAPWRVPYSFRVYIYEHLPVELLPHLQPEGSCPQPDTALEALLPDLLARSSVLTVDPEIADFYLVPAATQCFLYRSIHAGQDLQAARARLDRSFSAALDHIQTSFPYWNRTEGRDHVFVFPSQHGSAALSAATRWRLRKSLHVVGMPGSGAAGEAGTQFPPHPADAAAPPPPWAQDTRFNALVLPAALRPTAEQQDERKGEERTRRILLQYRGVLPHLHLPEWAAAAPPAAAASRLLLQLNGSLHGRDGVVFHLDAPGGSSPGRCGRDCSAAEMAQARFCLTPGAGADGWPLRLVDAVLSGCIPVIVADTSELPFEELLDWSSFSVKVPQHRIPQLYPLLSALDRSPLAAQLRSKLQQVRGSFQYHRARWQQDDAFDLLLRLLENRVRLFRNGPQRFWGGRWDS